MFNNEQLLNEVKKEGKFAQLIERHRDNLVNDEAETPRRGPR
jgi:hypothetical protein